MVAHLYHFYKLLVCSLIATPGTEAEDVDPTLGCCGGPSDINVIMLCVVCTPGHT